LIGMARCKTISKDHASFSQNIPNLYLSYSRVGHKSHYLVSRFWSPIPAAPVKSNICPLKHNEYFFGQPNPLRLLVRPLIHQLNQNLCTLRLRRLGDERPAQDLIFPQHSHHLSLRVRLPLLRAGEYTVPGTSNGTLWDELQWCTQNSHV